MRCYLCRRLTLGDDLAVTLDGAVRDVCSTCWERGQEGIEIRWAQAEAWAMA